MIDIEEIREWEDEYQALQDAVDMGRSLPDLSSTSDLAAVVQWHAEAKRILALLPRAAEAKPLTEFAEDLQREIEDLKSAVRAIEQRSSYPRDTGLLPHVREVFPAEIVTDVGGGEYTFKEKVLTDGTTWADKTGGRTGTCYEANDVAGIPVGTIFQIYVAHDTSGTLRYEFEWVLANADADYKVLQRKADDSIGFDWVRAH